MAVSSTVEFALIEEEEDCCKGVVVIVVVGCGVEMIDLTLLVTLPLLFPPPPLPPPPTLCMAICSDMKVVISGIKLPATSSKTDLNMSRYRNAGRSCSIKATYNGAVCAFKIRRRASLLTKDASLAAEDVFRSNLTSIFTTLVLIMSSIGTPIKNRRRGISGKI